MKQRILGKIVGVAMAGAVALGALYIAKSDRKSSNVPDKPSAVPYANPFGPKTTQSKTTPSPEETLYGLCPLLASEEITPIIGYSGPRSKYAIPGFKDYFGKTKEELEKTEPESTPTPSTPEPKPTPSSPSPFSTRTAIDILKNYFNPPRPVQVPAADVPFRDMGPVPKDIPKPYTPRLDPSTPGVMILEAPAYDPSNPLFEVPADNPTVPLSEVTEMIDELKEKGPIHYQTGPHPDQIRAMQTQPTPVPVIPPTCLPPQYQPIPPTCRPPRLLPQPSLCERIKQNLIDAKAQRIKFGNESWFPGPRKQHEERKLDSICPPIQYANPDLIYEEIDIAPAPEPQPSDDGITGWRASTRREF